MASRAAACTSTWRNSSMTSDEKDPFGRPLDTTTGATFYATEAEARAAMRQTRDEEAVSADDLYKQQQEQRQAEIDALESEAAGDVDVSDLDDYDDLLK